MEDKKEIIAYKDKAKNDPKLGFIKPLAIIEKSGNQNQKFININSENFESYENNVIIFDNYDNIDSSFDTDEMFKIKVSRIEKRDNEKDGEAAYKGYGNSVSNPRMVEKLLPKDLVEIIDSKLPDPNNGIVFLNNKPNTPYIVILDDDFYYGLFEWDLFENNTIKIKPFKKTFPGRNLVNGQIIKENKNKINENYLISFTIDHIQRQYLQNFNMAGLPIYEYSSDEEILIFCLESSKAIGNKNINISELEKILNQHRNNKYLKERWDKFEEIIEKYKSIKDNYKDYFLPYFKTSDGNEIVQEHIKTNESLYLAQLKQSKKNEIEQSTLEQNSKLSNLISDINGKEISLKNLEYEIDKKQEELKIKDEEKIKKILEEQDKAIKNKKNDIDNLQEKYEMLQEKYSEYRSFDDLNNKTNYLKQYNSTLEISIKDLEDLNNQNKKFLLESDQELRKKLMEIKPLINTINGSFNNIEAESIDLQVYCIEKRSGKENELIEDQQKVINSIKNYFKQQNRFMEDWEIANLLIISQQSLLTILAGLPGSGKTSLSRLFVKAQNLSKRFCEIPVSRGWTSSKELIGMYNPINSTFQSSSTGLYLFIKSLEKDSKINPMSYVLLDEANLSPIEHYWSSFIGMTDNDKNNEHNKLTLSKSEAVIISKSLRFLATINYDETTELLSPRILDRTPIIILETNLNNIEEDFVDVIDINSITYSQEIMEEIFGKNEITPVLEDLESEIIKKISDVLSSSDNNYGSPITISKRKMNNIKQYCYKAKPLMIKFKEELAIDLAILQYVLPLINGEGENYGRRLDEVKKILNEYNLEKSEKYVEKIISIGQQNYNSYNFFYW